VSPVKRSYRSPLREDAARATRRAVVAAAHALFVERGWATTTVQAVAERAGVSRPTVFAVGGKAQLLALARDVALAGDDGPAPVRERGTFQAVVEEPDLDGAVRLLAAHVSSLQSRYVRLDAVLHQASSSDAEARALWQRSEEERRLGAAIAVEALRAKGPVREPLERTVEGVWALTASEHYGRLVLDRGWAHDAYTGWLAGQLRAALL
jgi:AcrR family transcriptional regulator